MKCLTCGDEFDQISIKWSDESSFMQILKRMYIYKMCWVCIRLRNSVNSESVQQEQE